MASGRRGAGVTDRSGPTASGVMTLQTALVPRQHARTQRFTLGAPRAFTVAPDGARVVFLRSALRHGPGATCCGCSTSADGAEERVGGRPGGAARRRARSCPPQERARRERSREGSAGHRRLRDGRGRASWRRSPCPGGCSTAELRGRHGRANCRSPGPVVDPRPSPDGRHVAYVVAAARCGSSGADGDGRPGARRAGGGRTSPTDWPSSSRPRRWAARAASGGRRTADRLLVARVDDTPGAALVDRRPGAPGARARRGRLPGGGHPQRRGAAVRAGPGRRPHRGRAGTGRATRIWRGCTGRRRVRRCCSSRRATSAASCSWRWTRTTGRDPDGARATKIRFGWIFSPGCPRWTPDGRLVRIADEGGARVLAVGDRPLTGPQLHVRAVLDVAADDVLVSGVGRARRPPTRRSARSTSTGSNELRRGAASREEPGVHSRGARRGRDRARLRGAGPAGRPRCGCCADGEAEVGRPIASYAEDPGLSPRA